MRVRERVFAAVIPLSVSFKLAAKNAVRWTSEDPDELLSFTNRRGEDLLCPSASSPMAVETVTSQCGSA